MALDQPALQLILNVVMTTVATSMALICHLLRRDNQRLHAELDRRTEQVQSPSISTTPEKIGSQLSSAPVLTQAPPLRRDAQQDISEYVKRRSQNWIANGMGDARKAPVSNLPEAV